MIRNVQLLRALAALAVVSCHASGFWPAGKLLELQKFLFAGGFAGVDLFFVISGFIITTVACETAETDTRLRGTAMFAFNRVARLYPIYWIALAVTLLVSIFQNQLIIPGIHVTWLPIISLTATENPIVAVAWTMRYEVYFYAIVGATLFVSGTNFRLVAGILAGIYAMALVYWFSIANGPALYQNAIILDFLYGVGIFYLVDRNQLFFSEGSVVAGLLILGWGTWAIDSDPWAFSGYRQFYLGLPAALLLYGAIGLERYWKAPSATVSIGNSSYSIYLWHYEFFRIIGLTAPVAIWPLGTNIALTVAATLVGMVSYLYVERPIARVVSNARRFLFAKSFPSSGQAAEDGFASATLHPSRSISQS